MYAFIIGLVFLILVFVTIAISATVYVYVSGMAGPNPNPTPYAHIIGSQSDDDCTLSIMHVSREDIEWSDITYTLTDTTDLEEIDCNTMSNEVTVSYDYTYLEEGKPIFIYGGANNSDELETNNEYSFMLIYEPTGDILASYTWIQ